MRILKLDDQSGFAKICAQTLLLDSYCARLYAYPKEVAEVVHDFDVFVIDGYMRKIARLEFTYRAYVWDQRGSLLLMPGRASILRQVIENLFQRIVSNKAFSMQATITARYLDILQNIYSPLRAGRDSHKNTIALVAIL
jgi:DNA-binding NtrC family response regulator